MSIVENYKTMRFYQVALELADLTFSITKTFPDNERYGLIDQMNRSSVSVVSNIAEGSGRDTKPQLFQFFSHAKGSLNELDAQFDIAYRRGYICDEELDRVQELISEVSRTMWGFREHLETCQ